jgi:cellulose synthase/poly-beta-1,6-N-acetylglucosamine synthase-like glycosyltransferase
LSRSSSRSAAVEANMPWLMQTRPLVDVLICTYNEDRAILERTVIGAMAMSYPNFRVWVLDDGRRAWLSDLCAQKGCNYLTRPDNSHAKAGNINHASRHLAQLSSPPDFIAVLDADFVPFRNFVSRALCLFKDPAVGIVQTPQHFFNPDPIQSNLAISEVFPDEQRFFFDIIMPSKDAWELAFCCGTSSIIRFAALREIGGFPTDSVTEDFLLTIRLRERGYKTQYLNEKLTVGLAPEGINEYATQRTRWCLGLIQICRGRSGPFRLGNGLPLTFRISLIETFLYWGGSFLFRMFCMLAPALYFLFDIRMVQANLSDAIAHFAPMVITQVAITTWLGGGRMLPFIADVYQMLIAPEIIKVVAFTLIQPSGHKFEVTAKGIHSSGLNVQWGLLFRFLGLASITILGVAKVFAFDNSDPIQDGGALNLFWAWYNLLVLTICCLVCIEQPRRRLDERFSTTENVFIKIGDQTRVYKVTDISASGMRLAGEISDPVGTPATLIMGRIESPAVIARKGANEFAVSLIGDEARETMTRRVYSERYGKPLDKFHPGRVLAGILHRLAR